MSPCRSRWTEKGLVATLLTLLSWCAALPVPGTSSNARGPTAAAGQPLTEEELAISSGISAASDLVTGGRAGNDSVIAEGIGREEMVADPVASVRVRMVGPLTGSSSPNHTDEVDVVGTDLGIMAELGGRIFIAFGDTFSWNRSYWRSNVMAYTSDDNPADGVRLDGWITDRLSRAKELIPGRKEPNDAGGEVTKIPTALTTVGDWLYLAFMSVRRWGTPGHWEANYATWAYSDNLGQSWTVIDPPFWPEETGFIQLAVSQESGRGNEEGFLLILGTPAGRFGGARLVRVRPEKILDRAAYEYYVGADGKGSPGWIRVGNEGDQTEAARKATVIIEYQAQAWVKLPFQ